VLRDVTARRSVSLSEHLLEFLSRICNRPSPITGVIVARVNRLSIVEVTLVAGVSRRVWIILALPDSEEGGTVV